MLSLQKHGLVIIPEGTPNGDVSQEAIGGSITVVSQEAAQVLESAGEGPLGESTDLRASARCYSTILYGGGLQSYPVKACVDASFRDARVWALCL